MPRLRYNLTMAVLLGALFEIKTKKNNIAVKGWTQE